MYQALLGILVAGMAFITTRTSAPHVPWWGKLIRFFLTLGFSAAHHILFDLRVSGLSNFTNSPGTLIVANHKTDFDVVILAPTFYWAHRGPARRIAFVAAERMFLPGYISDYILHRPQWLRRLVYPANLSAVLKAIRAYPIGYLHARKLKAHLRTVLETMGNVPIATVLSRPVEEVIPGADPGVSISRVLRFRYHEALDREWPFSVLAPKIRRKLRVRHMREIVDALARFAAILDAGDPLYIAPEGGLETNGIFDEAKSGLIRIVQTARDAIIIPVNITYDFITTGKQRAFMTIGKELHGVKEWSRQRLEHEVIGAVSRLGTITFSQLAAVSLRRLAQNGDLIHTGALRQEIMRNALRLVGDGYRVDTVVLMPDEFAKRWRKFIAYCRNKRILELIGSWILCDQRALANTGEEEHATALSYAANEFNAIVNAPKEDLIPTEA